jgi:protein kinase C substrate 80K-H
MRDLAIDWLIRIGLIGKGDKAATKSKSSNDSPRKSILLQLLLSKSQTDRTLDVSAARNRHQTISRELDSLNSDIRRNEEMLQKMSDGYGPDAEWKKLDGTCIDKVHGE